MSSEVFPSYTEAEVFADRCVHAVGVTTGSIAAIALVIGALQHLPAGAATAVVIYALGMLAMFCFSAAYNLSRGPKRWLWRRCDHAAIFIKIAATYTPFAVAKMGGTTGFVLLAAVWGIALAGAAAKLIAPHRVASLSTLWYLAQGWTCVLTMQPLLSALSPPPLSCCLLAACSIRWVWRSTCPSGSHTTTPSGTCSCWSRRPATSRRLRKPWCWGRAHYYGVPSYWD